MKKTLLSVLAGLAVVGSAFALPTPEDMKALCEKYPDKYVWVQKTQACIEKNPCQSNNPDIKTAYCASGFRVFDFIDGDAVINRYAEKVLHEGVLRINKDADDYWGVVTIDKDNKQGYFAVEKDNVLSGRNDISLGVKEIAGILSALWAYGYDGIVYKKEVGYIGVEQAETDCRDVADFASLLSGSIIRYEYNPNLSSGSCHLFFDESSAVMNVKQNMNW